MKPRLLHASILLLFLPFLLVACNTEDDVMEIFTGRTWKLVRITDESSQNQFDFWNGDEAAQQNSLEGLRQENNYTLTFEAADTGNTTPGGSFNGRGVRATVEGSWRADGNSRSMSISVSRIIGSESDILARSFINGLRNATRYEGDNNNLFIYYTDGQTTKRLCLTAIN